MRIETARLTLLACTADLTQALLDDRDRAQALLGAALPEGWPDEELAGILPAYAARLRAHPAELGYGPWIAVLRDERVVVGSAGFMSTPDTDGSVEIGYGIHPDHRGAGHATEAAAALVGWALGAGARTVIAECDADNAASIRVLEKLGMRRTSERAGTIRWQTVPA